MDGIHMDSEATTGAMAQMDEAGGAMNTAWGEVSTRLSALSGRLGQGELGAAYMDGYRRPAADTTTAVDRHCSHPGQMAAMGHQCVGLYQTAGQNGAAALSAAEPPPLA